MKIRLHPVLVVLGLAILSPAGIQMANAQEGSYSIQEAFDEVEPVRDKIINSPGEVDPVDTRASVTVARDTAYTRSRRTLQAAPTIPAVPVNVPKPTSQDDDSVLSFNFLYYLFEKYKLQDIVD